VDRDAEVVRSIVSVKGSVFERLVARTCSLSSATSARQSVPLAVLAAAVTRPLGIHGAFYVVAGRTARAIDGMRPPWEDLLLLQLHPPQGLEIARRPARRVGIPVAIVDMNDRASSVRAVSHHKVSRRL
jgi:hypothetical protein